MDYNLSPEQQALQQRVRRLAQEKLAPLAHEADEMDDLHPGVTKALIQEGLFKYMAPKEYGGNGISVINICILREELSKVCAQADSTFAMQGLGSYSITIAGSDEVKRRYLPKVASGEAIAAFALTEPQAGSDVANLQTTATLDGDHYVINGTKRYISQCGFASFYTTFLKTDPAAGTKGISAIVVDKGTPGLDTSEKVKLLAPHVNGQVLYRNVRVPKSQLLGTPGAGMRIALSTLDVFRTTVSAAVLGMAEAAYAAAVKRAKERRAFGQPLADFQATQFKLADMATGIEAARHLIFWAAWLKDSGTPQVIQQASMAKLFATEMAQRVVDEALQIHGASGLEKGSVVEKLYREVRQPRVYEGSTEILKIVIAREILKGQ
jgi:alkylation response protein AidB-like acyl-CoA dehydrogenase